MNLFSKGPAQIATAVTFVVTPTGATLNNGNPIALISGDLNEDNKIDAADYAIAKGLVGTIPTSAKWNPIADLNVDGVVNNWDLEIINHNLGKTGDGGPWYSRIGGVATTSAELQTPPPNVGGENSSFTPYAKPGGYWMWVPAAQ